jgi:hypothetical protein
MKNRLLNKTRIKTIYAVTQGVYEECGDCRTTIDLFWHKRDALKYAESLAAGDYALCKPQKDEIKYSTPYSKDDPFSGPSVEEDKEYLPEWYWVGDDEDDWGEDEWGEGFIKVEKFVIR